MLVTSTITPSAAAALTSTTAVSSSSSSSSSLIPKNNNNNTMNKTIIYPPPPTRHQASWILLSQGAEARIWHIPNFISTSTSSSSISSSSSSSSSSSLLSSAICKERFPKQYRHATLDTTLTKSRTKGEIRGIMRSRKAGVNTPLIYAVDLPSIVSLSSPVVVPPTTAATVATLISTTPTSSASTNANANTTSISNKNGSSGGNSASTSSSTSREGGVLSSCIYMEMIQGCTFRDYLLKNERFFVDKEVIETLNDINVDVDVDNEDQTQQQQKQIHDDNIPNEKKNNIIWINDIIKNNTPKKEKQEPQECQLQLQQQQQQQVQNNMIEIAQQIGTFINKMHNAGVIHGDLTTCNILLRDNPSNKKGDDAKDENDEETSTYPNKEGDVDSAVRLVNEEPISSPAATLTLSSSSPPVCKKIKMSPIPIITSPPPPRLPSVKSTTPLPIPIFIDFGLASSSKSSIEDKAVDLYVLERSLGTTCHPNMAATVLKGILDGYSGNDSAVVDTGDNDTMIIDNTINNTTVNSDNINNTNHENETEIIKNGNHINNTINSNTNTINEPKHDTNSNNNEMNKHTQQNTNKNYNKKKKKKQKNNRKLDMTRDTLIRLDKVRMRGRKRECFG